MMFSKENYEETKKIVMSECAAALSAMDYRGIEAYLDAVLQAEKVFFIGAGRVLLTLECIAKRYAHLGIKSVVVGQVTEPAITGKDLLIVGSGSGETLLPAGIAGKAKTFGAKVVHIGSNPNSSIKDIVDIFVRIPAPSRAKAVDEIPSQQPMTSLFEQSVLLFGDITAMMIAQEKKMDIGSLWQFHANLE